MKGEQEISLTAAGLNEKEIKAFTSFLSVRRGYAKTSKVIKKDLISAYEKVKRYLAQREKGER